MLLRVPSPHGTKFFGKCTFSRVTSKHINLGVGKLVAGQLNDDVSRTAEARQSQGLTIHKIC